MCLFNSTRDRHLSVHLTNEAMVASLSMAKEEQHQHEGIQRT